MDILRIGMVGVGGMGHHHLKDHVQNPRVKIVAICDIKPGRAQERVDEFGLDAAVYTDFKEMIANEQLDAVDIATPNYLHPIIAVYAMDHGLHVFCEKPDAPKVEEALAMKEASERNGKVLMVMRNNRYSMGAQYAKQFIADGGCGEIYCGRCGWIRRRGIPGRGGWFTTKAQSGGGPLIDLGVHIIDLAIWLMGNPKPIAVSGCTYSKFSGNDGEQTDENSKFGDAVQGGTFDVEDLAMGFIRFDNGACLQIEFSWASNIGEGEGKFLELRGTKAGLKWEGSGVKIFGEQDGKTTDFEFKGQPVDAHGLALKHFCEIILDGKEKDYVPEQGVNMIRILNALYKSAELGHEVAIEY